MIRIGSYEGAITQLEQLYSSYPDDQVIVSTLTSALIEAKHYDRAETVLKQFVAKHPKDPKGLSDLASLYLIMDRKQDSLALLDTLIEVAPEEGWTYQMAFLVLSRQGAMGEAVALLPRARKATGDSALLARDAARVYRDLGRYDVATEEYLVAGQAERDPEMAIEGIVAMAVSPEARRAIASKLASAARADQVEDIIRGALWQIYLEDGDCDGAFAEVAALARAGRLSPETVKRFAVRSQAKGCSRQCAEVYGLALDLPENKADIPGLLLAKAECEQAGGLTDQAIATYGEVAGKYSGSKWAYDAEVALARIYRSQGLLAEAIAQADRVIAAAPAGDARWEAILFKGGCLVEAGRLDEAFTTYDLVATEWPPAYAQEAFYNLGEIKFYQGSIEDAVSYYNVTLREYPDEPRANDAIERLLLVKGVKGDLGTMWLKEYAQGALLRRQGRVDEAARIFWNRAGEQGKGAIKIESLRELAGMAAERGDLDGAIKLYKLVGDSLDTYYSPSALEAVGDAYLSLGRVPEAVQAYESVIIKYPASVSAGEARRKIDGTKRGDRDAAGEAARPAE
jgi:tetratricopeptide (TPR) repeat protein